MKKTPFSKSFLKQKVLAVPAAALMLGAAHAGTTIGVSFWGAYANYGYGWPSVTATAFGVPAAEWFTTPATNYLTAANGTMSVGPATVSWSAPSDWISTLEGDPNSSAGAWNSPLPGDPEVLWGYLASSATQAPAVSGSGLSSVFPNGYVIRTIAAVDANPTTFANVNIFNTVTTNTLVYSNYQHTYDWYGPGANAGGTYALSSPSAVFTNDTIGLQCDLPGTTGANSVLCGFIITDLPIITQEPVGGGKFVSGATFSLNAAAWGMAPLSYQWQTNGVPIAGATNSVYTKVNATASDTASYDIVVTDVGGAATSAVTSVSVVFYTTGTNAVWTNPDGGSWTAGSNWTSGIIANGSGASANFSTLTLPSDAFVTLDTEWTIGNLTFGDAGNLYTWEIDPGAGGALTLAAANTPAITVKNQTATITAPISGANGLNVNGPGTLALSDAAYTGPTTINGDAMLVLTNDSAFVSPIMVNSGSTLQVIGNGYTLPASAGITLSNSTLIGMATGSGEVFINGPITVQSNAALLGENTVRVDGGLYGSNVNLTVAPASGTSAAFQFNGPNGNFSGNVVISNIQVNVWSAGPNIFAQANVSLVSGALIELGNNVTGNGPESGNILRFMSLNGDSSATIGSDNSQNTVALGTNNGSGTFAGAINNGAGSGPLVSLIKEGTGTQVLTGVNNYTGATTVNAGTLEVDGSLASGSAVTVAGGTLDGTGTIGGPVNVLSGGTLTVGTSHLDSLSLVSTLVLSGDATFFISKTGGKPAQNQVQGATTVTYGGTLTVSNITSDSTKLANGDTFPLFSAGSFIGQFAAFNLPPLSAGLSWSAAQLPVSGSIAVINTTDPPVFTPAPGGYIGAQTVTVRCLTPGATIYYTTNGSVPTISSQQASSGLTFNVGLNQTLTINAFAQAPGVSASAVVGAFYAAAPDAVWASPSGGSWGMTNNWVYGITGQGSGITADFSQLTLTSDTYVTLDSSWTIGNLIFGDAGNTYTWEIDQGGGGTLTLAATNPPAITVLNQTATITTPVAGTNGMTKNGNGMLTFSGKSISYTGTSTINGGTLNFMDNGNGDGNAPLTSVLMGSNSALMFTSSGAASDFRGGIGGTGTITINGDVRFGPWGSVTQVTNTSGDVVVASGTLQVAGRSNYRMFNIPGNLVVSNGAEVSWNALDDLSPSTGSIFGALLGGGTLSGDYSTPYAEFGNGGASGTFSGIIQNALSITKIGSGTQILSGANTYTGTTTVSGGSLLIYGSLGTNTVTVQSGGTLGGNGTIGGPVTVLSGGTLMTDPAGINTLAIDNSVSLAGNVSLRINKATSAGDQLAGITSVTYGGTLTVTNLAGTLTLGNSFQLFEATNYAGAFAAFDLPPLLAGLGWKWTPASGTLSVVTAATPPVLSGAVALKGASFSLSFSGANGQSYTVLMTTNLDLPLASWTPLTNGTFGASPANYTDTGATNADRFYRIRSP